jgi:hypothetical protein
MNHITTIDIYASLWRERLMLADTSVEMNQYSG